MTARGDRKGLCLFDSDMPLRQRSELIGATVTAIGRSFSFYCPLEPKSLVGRAGTGQKRPRRRFRRDAFALLYTHSHISLEWRYVELTTRARLNSHKS